MLMLQLDAVQDSEQNHPEPTSESPYPPNVVTSPTTLQPVHQQLPVAAQLSNSAVSGLSPTAKSVLAAPTGNAPLKVHADDALLPTAPPELISNEMWHNSNSGPNSTPASMFHERQGKDAQTSVTSVNVAHHPLSLPCHTLNPTPQSSMPVSLQHVHPQQLSQVQLQNLHKAAKLLSLPVPAKAEAVQTPQAVLQPKRAAAPAIARCKLAAAAPPAHCRNHELAADANRHAEAPACLVHDTSAPSATTYPCMATHSPGSHTHSKHQLPPLHCSGGGDPSDAIAASLDGKLDRMAPAVSLLFVDTLRVGQRSTHVEPSAQRAVNDSQKRSFSAMQVEASAALPLAEAPTSQPDKADNEPPAPVQQDDVCLAKHRAQIGQGPDLVRTGKDVQRKRFRKPTGLEVLYRTRPLVCAQLYASGIQLQ